MSGNLKILVHKSWHVWKRENREKVARDERNFKEDNEKKEEKQKSLTQEKNLELLLLSQAADRELTVPKLLNSGAELPFRLFGDIEELDKKNKEIKDHIQAKKDKEFQDKKRSGEAPWALGEGAAEKIGSIVPYWYAKPGHISSSASSSSSSNLKIKSEWGGKQCEEEAQREREDLRKKSQDPMSGILKPDSKASELISIGGESFECRAIKVKDESPFTPKSIYPELTQRRNLNQFGEIGSSDKRKLKKERHSDGDSKHKRKRKSVESDSDDNDDSKHHSKSSKRADRGDSALDDDRKYSNRISSSSSSNTDNLNRDRRRSKCSSNDSSSSVDGSCSNLSVDRQHTVAQLVDSSVAALRMKRMEREYAERKRAAIVLAKADIFGPLNALGVGNLPDGRAQRYSQQFHPHIAR